MRWAKREPRTAALVGAIGVLCIAVPALLVAYSMRLSNAEERSEAHQKDFIAAKKAQKEAAEAGQTSRYLAAVSEAGRLRYEHRPGWTWAARAQIEAAAGTLPSRATRRHSARSSPPPSPPSTCGPMSIVANDQLPGAIAYAPDGRLAVATQFVLPLCGVSPCSSWSILGPIRSEDFPRCRISNVVSLPSEYWPFTLITKV